MHKLIYTIAAFALFTFAMAEAWAQGVPGVPTLADLRRVTDGAMVKVGAGDMEGGLKDIRPLTIIPPAEFDAMLAQLPPQMPGMVARFGASIGQEFIREERLGDSMARLIYINRLERHATRWMFYCYKGKAGWVVNTLRFDDKWMELF
jgi:hypothetical protein